jgi:excisionase family DNA binding protein
MQTQALTATLKEAQTATKLGRDFLRTLVKQGVLPNVGPRTRIRIPCAALERYINQGVN